MKLLLTPAMVKAARPYNSQIWHYNGGWVKVVSNIDDTCTNGYGLLGQLLPGNGMMVDVNSTIVDCDILGSRKNTYRKYYLYKFIDDGSEDGSLEYITTVDAITGLWKPLRKIWRDLLDPARLARDIWTRILQENDPLVISELRLLILEELPVEEGVE